MSERNIRERLGTIVATATSSANVHTTAVAVTSEEEAVTALGAGTDSDGLNLLAGWFVMPGKLDSGERISRGWVKDSYTFTVLGYRSRVDGAEASMEADLLAIRQAVMAQSAFAGMSPRPMPGQATTSVAPAVLAGFPVWEATMTLVVLEHATS